MAKVTLVGLRYSPWTQKARWALDHHGIGYRFEDYLPIVGAPMLRLRALGVSMASIVQTIKPVADRWIRLGPALREAWTRTALATRYDHLIAWRDRLFEKHRGARP